MNGATFGKVVLALVLLLLALMDIAAGRIVPVLVIAIGAGLYFLSKAS